MEILSEYDNPEIYEREYGLFKEDFQFFTSLKTTGSALDLACGSGRVTTILAKSGLNCTGIDTSDKMLKYAQRKSSGLDIKYILGDMRDFNISKKFDLITIAGNSFQALLTDEEQINMLNCVKQHLNNDGLFAFNTRNPLQQELRTIKDYEFWHDFTDQNGVVVKVYGKQEYNSSTKTILYKTKRIFPNNETITETKLRFTNKYALKDLLYNAGFEVINFFSDFQKNPLEANSENIIILAKLK